MTDHFSGAVTAAAERCSQKQPASKFCWRRVDPNPGTETAEGGGVGGLGGGLDFTLGSKDKVRSKKSKKGRLESRAAGS